MEYELTSLCEMGSSFHETDIQVAFPCVTVVSSAAYRYQSFNNDVVISGHRIAQRTKLLFYGIFLLLVLFSYGFRACHPIADVRIGFVIGWSIINTSYRKHFLCIFFGKRIICIGCVVLCPSKTASDIFVCLCIYEYMFMCISVLPIFAVYTYCQE